MALRLPYLEELGSFRSRILFENWEKKIIFNNLGTFCTPTKNLVLYTQHGSTFIYIKNYASFVENILAHVPFWKRKIQFGYIVNHTLQYLGACLTITEALISDTS